MLNAKNLPDLQVVQVKQRPFAEALWANVQLGQYSIYMIRRSGKLANIVTPLESRHQAKMKLMSDVTKTMEIEYETKPLVKKGACVLPGTFW